MEGRFLKGAIAGGAAGVVKDALDLFSYYVLHFTKTRYLDFSAALILGHRSRTIAETVFAQLAELGWSAALGILFCYLIPAVGPRNYLLKSTYFGIAAWFVIYAVVVMYRVPGLDGFPLASAVSNTATSVIYGLVLGLAGRRLFRTA